MIRVVIDTNVLVSAGISRLGLPARILDLVAAGEIMMCISPALLSEYREVLSRPHLPLNPGRVRAFLELLPRISVQVTPTHQLSVCKADDDDNRVLECADAANAAFLITGNTKHFPARWKNTTVLSPRQFMDPSEAEISNPSPAHRSKLSRPGPVLS